MVLEYGDMERLRREVKKWYLLELSSDKTTQSIMKRVGKQLQSIFRDDPVEIFLPVFSRDLDVFEMRTGNYVFARSPNFQALLRLKTVTGVVGLVTEGESNRPSKAIPVDDEYVQAIIKEAEAEFHNRAVGIAAGSFVRIIDGETRDYCGEVVAVDSGSAIVNIDLKTKQILVDTPIRNLIDLSHVPAELRTFYYAPLVEEMSREEDGTAIISEDLHYEEPSVFEEDEEPLPVLPESEMHHSRQRTVTALVKKLISEGVHEPLTIAKSVLSSIKKKEVRAPKNLFITYGIIKNNLKSHFSSKDPEITNYREVIHKYGRQYKFCAQDIANLDPTINIPVFTQDVCQDGRSREAREAKKRLVEAA